MDINRFFDENEKPLDNIVDDGGFFAIFRKFACVGDSLSSGEFEGTGENGQKTYHDMFEYSWGQYMARAAGSTALNFSRGGMTAKAYNDSFAESKGFWDKDKAAQAYIIALGVNDITQTLQNKMEFGSLEDVDIENEDNNKDTFVGNYAKIISKYKKIEKDAFFFLMTLPKRKMPVARYALEDKHAEIMYGLSKMFDRTFVLDFRKYAPEYDENFVKRFYLGGHLSPAGYILTAKMTASYIDYIIRHDMQTFKQVGFIGTPYRNTVDI